MLTSRRYRDFLVVLGYHPVYTTYVCGASNGVQEQSPWWGVKELCP